MGDNRMICSVCHGEIGPTQAFARRVVRLADGRVMWGTFRVMHLENCLPRDLLAGVLGSPNLDGDFNAEAVGG